MIQTTKLKHKFVHYIPEQLEPGVIYISMDYATAAHTCYCGCGEQVVTPFAPTDWQLRFDGETISLWPSIGNWTFPCRSHYIIERSRILEGRPWGEKQIDMGRQEDWSWKASYYDTPAPTDTKLKTKPSNLAEGGIWSRIKRKPRKN